MNKNDIVNLILFIVLASVGMTLIELPTTGILELLTDLGGLALITIGVRHL